MNTDNQESQFLPSHHSEGTELSEREKMEAGLVYSYADQELISRKSRAIRWCEQFNAIDGTDYQAQYEFLKQMLGAVGKNVWIAKTFGCDCGKNIFIGDNFTGNFNLTILDIREVFIGNNVMIGPNTLISTVGHPLSPKARRNYEAQALPVCIGNDVWIGGNVTILPGVCIGNNVVVAAGAVVSKDVPDNSLVAGVPAKVVRTLTDDTQEESPIRDIYLAGGCFWGAEHFFKLIDGVVQTEVGFANGNTDSPTYEEVYTDTTGHAETVHVRYDCTKVSLEFLLDMFFKAIDPTSINKQGHDEGTRYRTGVYFTDSYDLATINKVFVREQAKLQARIAVEKEPLKCFYPASDYHQDYLDKNPQGYCHLPLELFEFAKRAKDPSKRESATES